MATKRRALEDWELKAAEKLKELWTTKQAQYRKENGRILSQESASLEMGWQTQSTFYQYINGKLALNLENLLKFSAYFDVNPSEISPELAETLHGQHYEVTDNKLHLVNDSASDYNTSIDEDRMTKATQFVFEHVGIETMQHKGASWCAQLTLKLYDVFQDPASDNLKPQTLLKLVS